MFGYLIRKRKRENAAKKSLGNSNDKSLPLKAVVVNLKANSIIQSESRSVHPINEIILPTKSWMISRALQPKESPKVGQKLLSSSHLSLRKNKGKRRLYFLIFFLLFFGQYSIYLDNYKEITQFVCHSAFLRTLTIEMPLKFIPFMNNVTYSNITNIPHMSHHMCIIQCSVHNTYDMHI